MPLRRASAAAQLVRRIAARPLAAAAAALCLAGAPLAAQEASAPARVTLQGQVIDHATGQPIVGATVEVEKLHFRAVTDREGRFTLRKVHPGEQEFVVSRLGYQEEVRAVAIAPGAESALFQLRPDPVVLEGLTVKMNLLDRRHRQVAVASRAFGREALTATAAPTMLEFVQIHGGVFAMDCGRVAYERNCTNSRGSLIRPAVFVDEMPAFGLEGLRSVRPEEVERVEVYQRGRQIRVYTSHFMEMAARGNRYIAPVIF